uniref:Uncharacterized protein n=1 Tax=Rhizophora mucronata TaxID=61149 RepID=A0A2P2KPF8_RHIMU
MVSFVGKRGTCRALRAPAFPLDSKRTPQFLGLGPSYPTLSSSLSRPFTSRFSIYDF